MLSPQTAATQTLVQSSLALALASSHCSPAFNSTTPFEHRGTLQSALQVAVSPPSSQTSLPAPWFQRVVSPQTAATQALVQSSLSFALASSHCSPAFNSTTPFEHRGTLQSALQVAVSPPSSQASLPSTTPFPHKHCDGTVKSSTPSTTLFELPALAATPMPLFANARQIRHSLAPALALTSACKMASRASRKDGLQVCNFNPSTTSCIARLLPPLPV